MLKTLPALAALAVAAALVVPTVSHAQDTRSMRVSYGDLNIGTDVGQSRLQRRIAYAAESVCGFVDGRDLTGMKAVKSCRSGAIADAQPAFQAAVAQADRRSVEVIEAAALVVSAN